LKISNLPAAATVPAAALFCSAAALFCTALFCTAAVLFASAGAALAADSPGLAFDQLDLPIACAQGCPSALHGPGRFEADYARFVREHPDSKHPYTPGILYRVATFGGWTRIESLGVVTICSPRGDDLIVLDLEHRVAYHSQSILETVFHKSPAGCRSSVGRDYYRVNRLPGSEQRLPPIVVDGIDARGHSAKYAYRFATARGAAPAGRTFRITTYSANFPEPCPPARVFPSMAVAGNTCGGDKRFLIFRTSVTLDENGKAPAFVHGGLGILNERGHLRPLHARGDLFSVPAGFADACARGGHDTIGLCPSHRFHSPQLLRDKD
jgi:hypothetical protein